MKTEEVLEAKQDEVPVVVVGPAGEVGSLYVIQEIKESMHPGVLGGPEDIYYVWLRPWGSSGVVGFHQLLHAPVRSIRRATAEELLTADRQAP